VATTLNLHCSLRRRRYATAMLLETFRAARGPVERHSSPSSRHSRRCTLGPLALRARTRSLHRPPSDTVHATCVRTQCACGGGATCVETPSLASYTLRRYSANLRSARGRAHRHARRISDQMAGAMISCNCGIFKKYRTAPSRTTASARVAFLALPRMIGYGASAWDLLPT
jgi:hypothetical protein